MLADRRSATRSRVLSSLSDKGVCGLYYFGEGFYPREGDDGCLMFSDGPLYASELIDAEPMVRFAFLNTCLGPASQQHWAIEPSHGGVAGALARGGTGRVVIARIWPLVSTQAAQLARDFFTQASPQVASGLRPPFGSGQQPCALRAGRSRHGLDGGDMVLLGDPNKALWAPSPVGLMLPQDVKPGRVFDGDFQLNADVFGFAINAVLFRAAKRRHLQGRALVTIEDFIAGLVRKGDFTRLVLRRLAIDPDSVYQLVGEKVEPQKPARENAGAGRSRAAEVLFIVIGIISSVGQPGARPAFQRARRGGGRVRRSQVPRAVDDMAGARPQGLPSGARRRPRRRGSARTGPHRPPADLGA